MKTRWIAMGAVLVAVGFGAGWLVFDAPVQLGGITANDVEDRLLARERVAGRDADKASCEPRQASSSQFLCTVTYANTDPFAHSGRFLVTARDGVYTFEERPPRIDG